MRSRLATVFALCAALAGCGLVPDDPPRGGDGDGECVPGISECADSTRLRTCFPPGIWQTYECPATYDQLPEGCAWTEVIHGCQDGECWLDCDEVTSCFSDGACADEATLWACLDQHMGLELVDCDEHFEWHGETCACGAWCEEWAPGHGDCRCDCEGACGDHAPGDPGCECCWSDAGVDGGSPDPDAGIDGGVDAGG